MATGRIVVYDRAAQKSAPLISNAEPELDSSSAPWVGIKLEHYRIGDSDRADATTHSYLAAVCLSGAYETEYLPGGGQRGFSVRHKPGDVFLTGPCDLPARRSTGTVEFLALELAPKFVLWAADELVTNGTFEVQQLWSAKEEQLRHIMLTLHHELQANCRSGQLFGEYMGLSFATALLTRHSSVPARLSHYRGGLSQYKLRQVTDFINDNLAASLSLADMAKLLDMGPCHFARAFKESTGVSPHQYVLRRRVERALQLLKETRVNLADIAYDLGFSSQGHFTTVFRKLVGVSPSSYREQLLSAKGGALCASEVTISTE